MKNFYKLILFALCLCSYNNAISQAQIIKTIDYKGKIIENAFIMLLCGKSTVSGYTDSNGELRTNRCLESSLLISVQILGFDNIDTTIVLDTSQPDTLILKMYEARYDIQNILFTAPKDIQTDKLGFNPKDFLRMAGSFDDPSRLLNKQAAFVSTNDQNNAISFRGMPTKFNKWQINGMEVISPNHLSNAGTRDDVSSPNAGGTNMISGQLISSYQYIKPEDMASTPNQLSGTSNINTRSGLKPYAQISVIGLEAGTGIEHGNTTLDINYRYSFTGLLSDLGASFGGEEIKFQDFYASLNSKIKGIDLQFLTIVGSSSNDFNAPDTATIQKELTDINFMSDNRIFGFNGKKIMKNWVITFGSFYSDKVFQRSATLRNNNPESIILENQSKLSNSFKISKNNFSFGINQILDRGSLSISKLETVPLPCFCKNPSLNLKLTNFDIFINRKLAFGEDWLFDMTLSYRPYTILKENLTSLAGYFYPKVMLEKPLFQNTKINLSLGRNSQNVHDSKRYYQIDGNYAVLNVASKFKKNNISLEAFYHDAVNFFNIFDEGTNYFALSHPLELNGGKGRTYGLTLAHQYNSQLFWAASNGSFFNSESQITSDLKYTPSFSDYNYTFSLQLGKNFKVGNNTLALSIAQIGRGGQLSTLELPRLSSSQLYRSRDFIRLDARISYTFKKSILSLDMQNLLNRPNETYRYFDSVQMKNLFGNQLGLIPVLSYRYYFHDKPIHI